MPIEYGDIPWPPAHCKLANGLYETWGAWYSGDPKALADAYSDGSAFVGHVDTGPLVRRSQFSGGVVGALARFFWGRPTSAQQPAAKLHIPAAGDLSSFSSDLLFGEPPEITLVLPGAGEDGRPAVAADLQSAYDDIAEAIGLVSRYLEGAEQQSAMGGIYLRASIPPPLRVVDGRTIRAVDAPVVEVIPPEAAVPDWSAGFLVGVTFWRKIGEASGYVYRHLERHEPGRVYHALYRGSVDKLGVPVPLTEMDETARFAPFIADDGGMDTGSQRLAVEYVPNMKPMRIMRGTPLGRSDYSGAEGVMDALDETWSSWMRDIRLGKGRIVVPESMLQSQGPGGGALFDVDREAFAAIDTLPKNDGGGLTVAQFAIRVAEHQATAAAAVRQIWRTAGYSAGAADEGQDNGQGAATATEVNSRNSRTTATRQRKINYWKPALRRLTLTLLDMYASTFNGPAVPEDARVMVEFAADAQISPLVEAQTLQLLATARAVSIKTMVEMLHPEWEPDAVLAEVASIEGRAAEGDSADPSLFG